MTGDSSGLMPKFMPEFDESEIRRLPHLATDRICSRLEQCKLKYLEDGDSRCLDEADRLVRLFPEIGAVTEDSAERSEIIAQMVLWQNWVRSKGKQTERDRLKPCSIKSSSSDNRYAIVDDESVMTQLETLAAGNHVRGMCFNKVNFTTKDQNKIRDAFKNGRVVDCEFRGCNFNTVEMPNARLVRVVFDSCRMRNVRMKQLVGHDIRIRDPQDIAQAEFDEAVFFSVVFDGFDKDTSKKNISFTQAVFADCLFKDMIFDNSDFSSASFVHCDIKNTRFDGCDLSSTILHDTRFSSCKLVGGTLANALLNECNMAGMQLEMGESVQRKPAALPVLEGIDCKSSFDCPENIWMQLPDDSGPPVADPPVADWERSAYQQGLQQVQSSD